MGFSLTSPKMQFFDNSGRLLAGGKLLTKEVGGGADKATYSDALLASENTNPVILNARGEASVYAAAGASFWLRLTDASDVTIWTADNQTLPGTVTDVGTTLYPRTAAEIAAGVTPTSYLYAPGDVRRYGAVGDGAADDTTPVSNAVLSNDRVFGEPGATYRLTSGITLIANQVFDATGLTFDIDHATTAFTLAAGCTWIGGKIVGPGIAYTIGSIGMYAAGFANGAAVAPTRVANITINDVWIDGFGEHGINLGYCEDVRINRPRITNLGYSGVFVYSGRAIRIYDPWIDTLAGESDSGELNAYGVAFTSMTGVGIDTVRYPISVDCGVYGGTVVNIPTWHALDTHGGQFIEFKGVTITNCRRGAILTNTTTSGASDCTIENCEYQNFYAAGDTNSNGTLKRAPAWWDIGPSSSVRNQRNVIRNNVSSFAGDADGFSGSSVIWNAQDGEFSNNRTYGAYNCGLLVYEYVRRYEITGNTFTDVRSISIAAGSTTDYPHCIRFLGTDLSGITVSGNTFARKNSALDVQVGAVGLLFETAANRTVYLGNNTYDGITIPQSGTFTGITGEVHALTAIASAATITIPFGTTIASVTGTTNITSVTATAMGGQMVTLVFAGALTFTDGSNLKLAGNFGTSADDTITLVCDGTNWHEVSRSVN